mmetsp:Transcript_6800/g.10629  ORF Transcript_6800/g.10629 Transcript_6800/m.10629 type:complete len:154 (-) Transcript_6800:120-581(-)|eukprot:CAMPEP_0201736296 /NCGR_PEP_ID=MMETSP0593-20130828/39438_1 /ASSEMBLY_ACC=CAM_ASM_000672 /TAXON_ID=267983 /ORGANISM="Skeletonema japonicum, Strain CCMP2506" /LENGTH=153 /DNA_ID=CAMNT_0048230021 /DNA_START=84 /DNA_END=545 /DNA_ORIENTATION=-
MGAACCKCTPRWKNEEDVLCAYLYEECAFCRPKKFILRGCRAGDDDHEWNAATNATVRKLVEEDIFNPYGEPVEIAADVPKACCGYEMFEVAIARLEKDWSPKINQKIEPYGYMVEGFEWVEYRYVSQGQYGGHTQPVPHFCIRVKKLPEKDE